MDLSLYRIKKQLETKNFSLLVLLLLYVYESNCANKINTTVNFYTTT